MVFCDFLTIYQEHSPLTTPDLNSGRFVRLKATPESHEQVISIVDEWGEILADGGLEFTSARALTHEGSYDTSIHIKAEGGRVEVSGNLGRFGRPDNVFGYGVGECVRIANAICRSLDLPVFTWGNVRVSDGAAARGVSLTQDAVSVATGRMMKADAIITRIDLTKNYVSGSQENLAKLIHYMGGMHVRNTAPSKCYATGVTWGEGSKHWYAKLYDKWADLVRSAHAAPELVQWVRDSGIARFEVSLKSRWLNRKRLQSVSAWESGEMAKVIYGKFDKVITGFTVGVDSYQDIPGRLGEIAIAWREGVDMERRLPKTTFYRFRKQLLGYGIDIKEPCDVSRLPIQVRTISLSEAKVPEWYSLPIPLAA